MNRTRNIIYIVTVVLIVACWQFFATINHDVRVLISSPSLMGGYLTEHWKDFLSASWTTFYESLAGLSFAVTFSFLAMTLCFYFKKLMGYILPIMVVSQVIPMITLAPLFIMIFGLGATSKILMAAVICFFPIFVNFANGVKLISPNIHELLFINNATKTQAIKYIYFPLSLPYIMAGLKVAATLSVIGAIVAEFSGAETGLGRNLYISALRLEPEMMMTSLVLSSALGGILFGLIYFIESKLGTWYLKKQ